jgi:hypothetical protein
LFLAFLLSPFTHAKALNNTNKNNNSIKVVWAKRINRIAKNYNNINVAWAKGLNSTTKSFWRSCLSTLLTRLVYYCCFCWYCLAPLLMPHLCYCCFWRSCLASLLHVVWVKVLNRTAKNNNNIHMVE